jgi:acyl carrier protein
MKTTKKAAPKKSTKPALDSKKFETDLVSFINTTLVPQGKGAVSAETQLFEEGLINSIKILDLMAFVEKALGEKIPDRLVVMKNFRSARAITSTFVGS